MNITPLGILPFFILFGIACTAIGYAAGRMNATRDAYCRGYRNGMREERSHANARIIPAPGSQGAFGILRTDFNKPNP